MSDSTLITLEKAEISDYVSLFQDDDWLVFCKCFYNLYRNRNSCRKLSTLYFKKIPHICFTIRDICSDIQRQPYCYSDISVTGKLSPSKATRILNTLVDTPNLPPLLRKEQLTDIYNNVSFYYAPTEMFLKLFTTVSDNQIFDYSCYMFMYEEPPHNYQWVYCFYNPDSGLTKIGVSNNINRRKKDLEYSSGSDLILLYSVKCYEHLFLEKLLHSYFSDYRRNGEWFRLSTHDNNCIKDIFATIIKENGLFIVENEEVEASDGE